MKYFTTLKALAAASLALGTTTGNSAITMETVKVWGAGNPPDTMRMQDGTNGYGSVNYHYNIGKYEVTVEQYTAFLNAVAATDTHGLYNVAMGTDMNGSRITRSGQSGSYKYSVRDNGLMPVTYVGFGDALRFANWLSNGQPTGAQSEKTTEDGAYAMKNFRPGVSLKSNTLKNTVNPNTGKAVSWWVPSENEWYKAAYYSGSGSTYWRFPTRSNFAPGNVVGSVGGANYYTGAGYSVTQRDFWSYSRTRNYLTSRGAYVAPSHYGTYDQGGNVHEWIDVPLAPSAWSVWYPGYYDVNPGLLRGGSWNSSVGPESSFRGRIFGWPAVNKSDEKSDVGFRVAGTPTP